MKLMLIMIVAVMLVLSSSGIVYYEYSSHKKSQDPQPPKDLNAWVRSQLTVNFNITGQIGGAPRLTELINETAFVDNVMKGFYILENNTTFKTYYAKYWQNFSVAGPGGDANTSHYNKSNQYGLGLSVAGFAFRYLLPDKVVNGVLQDPYWQYIEYDISGTGNITGPLRYWEPVMTLPPP